MVKIFLVFLLATGFILGPQAATAAEELTINDVKQIAPQLSQVLSQLLVTVQARENIIARQNLALGQIGATIGAIGNAIADIDKQDKDAATTAIFNTQVDTLFAQMQFFGTVVDNISRSRRAYEKALDNITQIIGSIASTISEAKVSA